VRGGFTVQVGDSSRSLPLQAPLTRR
jgi:hypothetical protein